MSTAKTSPSKTPGNNSRRKRGGHAVDSTKSFGRQRNQPLRQLRHASKFARTPVDLSVEELIEVFKRYPDVLGPLEDVAAQIGNGYGRPRDPGRWVLILLAFFSGGRDFSKMRRQLSKSMWKKCGFQRRPSLTTVTDRLSELVALEPALQLALSDLVKRAARFDPEIGRGIVIDGTASASPYRVRHCCRHITGKPCIRRLATPLATPEEVRTYKHLEDSGQANPRPAKQRKKKRRLDEHELRSLGVNDEDIGRYAYYEQEGCYLRSLDRDAGVRAYTTGKWWCGYTALAAVDMYTGLRLAVYAQPADVNERDAFLPLVERAAEVRGLDPHIVAGDRAFSYKEIFEGILKRGIGHAIPYRQFGASERIENLVRDSIDQHSVPRCKHCGSECDMHGAGLGQVSSKGGDPQLAVRCMTPYSEECEKVQRHDVTAQVRLYNWYARTDLVHAQASSQRNTHENSHRATLDRSQVGGTHWHHRMKVRGLEFQQLALTVAAFLDMFRFCLLHGYLAGKPSAHRNKLAVEEISPGEYLSSVLDERHELELWLPQGAQAVACGRRPPD